MTLFSQIRPLNLRDQVADQIRTAIIEGRLKPNDHISENALTDELGVSRTPIREALIILEREALIVSVPHRGCFVRAFTEEDVEALMTMRTALENFAAELNIQQLTDADYAHLNTLIEQQRRYIEQDDFKQVRSTDMSFHQFLINYTNHPLLMRSWQSIVAQIAATLYLRADAQPGYDEYEAIRDHQKIVDAYRNRDLARVMAENRRINMRVAGECIAAVHELTQREAEKQKRQPRTRLNHPNG
jgi:DNA-binding GntR family transcriptional regulator